MSSPHLTPTTRCNTQSTIPLADLFLIFGVKPESLSMCFVRGDRRAECE